MLTLNWQRKQKRREATLRIIERDGKRCHRCKNDATEAHRWGGRCLLILPGCDGNWVAVCARCHEDAHYDVQGLVKKERSANDADAFIRGNEPRNK